MSKTKNTWDKVMDLKSKDTRSKGVANNLKQDELETIIATIDFFGGNTKQAYFDLKVARYRVFDWLAMGVQGDRLGSRQAAKVMAYSFLKVNGDIDKWIDDLRVSDYQMDTAWEKTELCYKE